MPVVRSVVLPRDRAVVGSVVLPRDRAVVRGVVAGVGRTGHSEDTCEQSTGQSRRDCDLLEHVALLVAVSPGASRYENNLAGVRADAASHDMPVWLMIWPPPIEGGRCAGEVSARPAYGRRSPLDGTRQPR